MNTKKITKAQLVEMVQEYQKTKHSYSTENYRLKKEVKELEEKYDNVSSSLERIQHCDEGLSDILKYASELQNKTNGIKIISKQNTFGPTEYIEKECQKIDADQAFRLLIGYISGRYKTHIQAVTDAWTVC